MTPLIIFAAKYLIIVSALLTVWVFWKLPRDRRKNFFFFALIALPLTYLVAKIAGHLYFDPRPFVSGGFVPLIPHAPDNGFPSDHALLAAALACLVWFYDRRSALALWIIALLIGAARVAAGIHFWRDVAGSLVIAVAIAFVVNAMIVRKQKRPLSTAT